MMRPFKRRRDAPEVPTDGDERLAQARRAVELAKDAHREAAPIAARSAELADMNGIAATIARSLQ
jgi:hypothetical protein